MDWGRIARLGADDLLGAIGTYVLAGAVIFLGSQAVQLARWQNQQPEVRGQGVVASIRDYESSAGLGLGSQVVGKTVRLEGREERIRYLSENWDGTVEVGDTVGFAGRSYSPNFQDLDGLFIDDHK
ncbi:MAG: hypothetical protein ABH864_03390 [archaeon]